MKILVSCLLAASAMCVAAQTTPSSQTAALPAPATAAVMPAALLPGSKVYIEPMDGFETFLAAAFVNKQVPLLVVDSKAEADFIITGTSKTEKAGWASTLMGSPNPHAWASVKIKSAKTGVMTYAYNVDKPNARKADQSTAEACAKHIREFMEKGAKAK